MESGGGEYNRRHARMLVANTNIYISMDYDKIRQIFDYCEDANTWPYHYHQIGIITGYTSIHIVWGN